MIARAADQKGRPKYVALKPSTTMREVHAGGKPEEELGAGFAVSFDVGNVLDAIGLDFGEAVAVTAVFGNAAFSSADGFWAHYCPNVGGAPWCAAYEQFGRRGSFPVRGWWAAPAVYSSASSAPSKKCPAL